MTAFVDSLGRYGARLRPGAGGFFAWWGRALASWLPASWRALFGLVHERLLLSLDMASPDMHSPDASGLAEASLLLRLQTADGLRDVGRVPWAGVAIERVGIEGTANPGAGLDDPLTRILTPPVAKLPRWLLLPAGTGLRRRMLLPAAAADRLRDVLAFEIDRQTPFSADAVYFDARIVERRDDAQLDVELIAVPRAALDAMTARLGVVATTLAGADLADNGGAPLGVNLLPDLQRNRIADPLRAWNWAFATVAVIALAAGMWQVLANRRAAADAFEREVASRTTQARRVTVQRQQLMDVVEGAAFLDRTRAARPTTTEVIDDLSRRLPNSTYLEKLAIEDTNITLIGLSSEASSLVDRLQASKLWKAPTLTGALQPDPRTGTDRFTLTAELNVAPVPGKQAADARRPR
ncbi:MAG: PilN domain-containing protein [Pseudomonadota bacterium]|nr:PilN domain-containing protein [Pseudomonadota bacterium]